MKVKTNSSTKLAKAVLNTMTSSNSCNRTCSRVPNCVVTHPTTYLLKRTSTTLLRSPTLTLTFPTIHRYEATVHKPPVINKSPYLASEAP
jgi:hypothetical protein